MKIKQDIKNMKLKKLTIKVKQQKYKYKRHLKIVSKPRNKLVMIFKIEYRKNHRRKRK